ncbi:16S rRNA (uracil(1498)-N(3))-methyltransferase [Fangia hongkongensis]|uniref:16S rRNA (uracil(1498)-N(3))-methyltransferase n=2 Tax=Fangia hongkongensis TaxID=270495 RepID=UPI00037C3D42|nr:16S rRNA (uracil(1498)-N(3))-methyltransferase [Fangia hongkongensis]
MRISRVYSDTIHAGLTSTTLSSTLSHYLIRVLRHKKSHQVKLFNNHDGIEYLAEITDANSKGCTLEVIDAYKVFNESPIKIHLYQALSKGGKFEAVVQKATELGVNTITPMITEHVDFKLPTEKLETKVSHWQKVAISAAEQSQRVFFPKLSTPMCFNDVLKEKTTIKAADQLFVLLCPHQGISIQKLHKQYPDVKAIHLFIGPEGGFSETENNQSLDLIERIKLGPRVLRTETTPVAICAIIQTLWGDF